MANRTRCGDDANLCCLNLLLELLLSYLGSPHMVDSNQYWLSSDSGFATRILDACLRDVAAIAVNLNCTILDIVETMVF